MHPTILRGLMFPASYFDGVFGPSPRKNYLNRMLDLKFDDCIKIIDLNSVGDLEYVLVAYIKKYLKILCVGLISIK